MGVASKASLLSDAAAATATAAAAADDDDDAIASKTSRLSRTSSKKLKSRRPRRRRRRRADSDGSGSLSGRSDTEDVHLEQSESDSDRIHDNDEDDEDDENDEDEDEDKHDGISSSIGCVKPDHDHQGTNLACQPLTSKQHQPQQQSHQNVQTVQHNSDSVSPQFLFQCQDEVDNGWGAGDGSASYNSAAESVKGQHRNVHSHQQPQHHQHDHHQNPQALSSTHDQDQTQNQSRQSTMDESQRQNQDYDQSQNYSRNQDATAIPRSFRYWLHDDRSDSRGSSGGRRGGANDKREDGIDGRQRKQRKAYGNDGFGGGQLNRGGSESGRISYASSKSESSGDRWQHDRFEETLLPAPVSSKYEKTNNYTRMRQHQNSNNNDYTNFNINYRYNHGDRDRRSNSNKFNNSDSKLQFNSNPKSTSKYGNIYNSKYNNSNNNIENNYNHDDYTYSNQTTRRSNRSRPGSSSGSRSSRDVSVASHRQFESQTARSANETDVGVANDSSVHDLRTGNDEHRVYQRHPSQQQLQNEHVVQHNSDSVSPQFLVQCQDEVDNGWGAGDASTWDNSSGAENSQNHSPRSGKIGSGATASITTTMTPNTTSTITNTNMSAASAADSNTDTGYHPTRNLDNSGGGSERVTTESSRVPLKSKSIDEQIPVTTQESHNSSNNADKHFHRKNSYVSTNSTRNNNSYGSDDKSTSNRRWGAGSSTKNEWLSEGHDTENDWTAVAQDAENGWSVAARADDNGWSTVARDTENGRSTAAQNTENGRGAAAQEAENNSSNGAAQDVENNWCGVAQEAENGWGGVAQEAENGWGGVAHEPENGAHETGTRGKIGRKADAVDISNTNTEGWNSGDSWNDSRSGADAHSSAAARRWGDAALVQGEGRRIRGSGLSPAGELGLKNSVGASEFHPISEYVGGSDNVHSEEWFSNGDDMRSYWSSAMTRQQQQQQRRQQMQHQSQIHDRHRAGPGSLYQSRPPFPIKSLSSALPHQPPPPPTSQYNYPQYPHHHYHPSLHHPHLPYYGYTSGRINGGDAAIAGVGVDGDVSGASGDDVGYHVMTSSGHVMLMTETGLMVPSDNYMYSASTAMNPGYGAPSAAMYDIPAGLGGYYDIAGGTTYYSNSGYDSGGGGVGGGVPPLSVETQLAALGLNRPRKPVVLREANSKTKEPAGPQ